MKVFHGVRALRQVVYVVLLSLGLSGVFAPVALRAASSESSLRPLFRTLTAQAADSSFTIATGPSGPTIAFQSALYAVNGTTSSASTPVQVKVEDGSGAALSGETVNWSISSPGGANGAALSVASSSTDGSGIASATVSGADARREVSITATLQSDSSKTATATVRFGDPLPNGFLALFASSSYSTKNWSDAGAFCAQQGGRLPRIKNSNEPYSGGSNLQNSNPVDGFCTLGDTYLYPPGLYWTGTEVPGYPGYSWIVIIFGSYVDWHHDRKTTDYLVVCVP